MSLLRFFKMLTGAKGATLEGAPTSTNQGADRQGLDVQLRQEDGTAINDIASETTLQEVKDNQTNKTQFTKITDGTNDAVVTGANELKVYDDQSKTVLEAIDASLQNIDANTFLIQQNQIDGDQKTQVVDNLGVNINFSTLTEQQTQTARLNLLLSELAFQARINTLGQKTMANSTPVVLPSDQVLNINTSTANPPVGSQIGSYVDANKVFSFSIDLNAASSGTNNPMITINNPAGSGKKISVFAFYAGTSITNVAVEFKVFANPTISVDGTLQTAVNNNVGDATPSVSVIRTLPTVTISGTELRTIQVGQNNNSASIADSGSLTIKENNTILITANPSSNNRSCNLTLIFLEL